MPTWLNGWKTYAVCAVTVAWAVLQYSNGGVDANGAADMILAALAAAGLRHGISTSK